MCVRVSECLFVCLFVCVYCVCYELCTALLMLLMKRRHRCYCSFVLFALSTFVYVFVYVRAKRYIERVGNTQTAHSHTAMLMIPTTCTLYPCIDLYVCDRVLFLTCLRSYVAFVTPQLLALLFFLLSASMCVCECEFFPFTSHRK